MAAQFESRTIANRPFRSSKTRFNAGAPGFLSWQGRGGEKDFNGGMNTRGQELQMPHENAGNAKEFQH